MLHLSHAGEIFAEDANRHLLPVPQSGPMSTACARLRECALSGSCAAFFRRPFCHVTYVRNHQIVGRMRSSPSSFYPSSPFDVFNVLRRYLETGEVHVPRFYLYPSSFCNARCPICQFSYRHRKGAFLRWEVIEKVLEEFAPSAGLLQDVGVIISGDGEPTLHPDFDRLLRRLSASGFKSFLTTNMMWPRPRRRGLVEAVADGVSMLTVSIKGLNAAAYNQYQGLPPRSGTLDVVFRNLADVLERLTRNGRRSDVLVGVATLVLPENTPSYGEALRRLLSMGLDYVYFNVVEPSSAFWNITFTERQIQETREFLESLAMYENCGTLIRYPSDPFRLRHGDTAYYHPNLRKNPAICGSALFNPLVIPKEDGDGILLTCRSSVSCENPEMWFTESVAATPDLKSVLSGARRNSVMDTASRCEECRLERQVILFDELLNLEQSLGRDGEFMLTFAVDRILKENGPIPFEQTF